jgi:hypothetical protein
MGCFIWIGSIVDKLTVDYGTLMEKYIASRNPKNLADIELFMLEFNRKLADKTLTY